MTRGPVLLLLSVLAGCSGSTTTKDLEDSPSDTTDSADDSSSSGVLFSPPDVVLPPAPPSKDPPERYVPCPPAPKGAEVVAIRAFEFADAVTYAPDAVPGYYGWSFQFFGVDHPWNRSDPTVFQSIADGSNPTGHGVNLWVSLPSRAPQARPGTYAWAEPYGPRPGFHVSVYDDFDKGQNVVYGTDLADPVSATVCLSRVWPDRVSGTIDYTPTADRHYFITFDVEGPDPAAGDATHCLWNRYIGFTEAEAWDSATWSK